MSDNSVEVYQGETDAVSSAIQALAEGKQTVFSTIAGDDFASKMKVLQATTQSKPLSENLGKKINLKDLVIQVIEMPDEKGTIREQPRTILVDVDGTAYHAISGGVFRAVENILGILGKPDTWPAPVPVKVVQEGQGNRKYFTIYPA